MVFYIATFDMGTLSIESSSGNETVESILEGSQSELIALQATIKPNTQEFGDSFGSTNSQSPDAKIHEGRLEHKYENVLQWSNLVLANVYKANPGVKVDENKYQENIRNEVLKDGNSDSIININEDAVNIISLRSLANSIDPSSLANSVEGQIFDEKGQLTDGDKFSELVFRNQPINSLDQKYQAEENVENDMTTGVISKIIIQGLETGNFENGVIQLNEKIVLNDIREEFQEKSKELQEKINQQGYLSLDDLGDYRQEVIDRVTYSLKDRLKTSIGDDTLIQNKAKNRGILTMDFLRERVNENDDLHRSLILYFDFINSTSGENIDYTKDPALLVNNFNTFLYTTYLSWNIERVDFSMLSRYAKHDFGLRTRRIERLKRWNSEINSRRINATIIKKEDTSYTSNKKALDLQNASGTQIIEEAGISDQLVKYDDTNIDNDVPDEKIVQFRKKELPVVRQNFVDKHDEIKDYIVLSKFMEVYNPEDNKINFPNPSLDNKQNLRVRLGEFGENVDIDRIYSILMSFPDEMDNMVKNLSADYVSEQEQANNNKRIETAGFVLDNVKSLFDGFTYDEKAPVTIQGDKLIIKGSIKGPETENGKKPGSKIKICYDLESGKLYMNSFLKEDYFPNPVITIGERWNRGEDYPEADTEIGLIGSFSEILSYNDIFDEDQIEEDENNYSDDIPYQNNINPPSNNIPNLRDFIHNGPNIIQDNNNGLVEEDIEKRRRIQQSIPAKWKRILRPGERPIRGGAPRPDMQKPLRSYENNSLEKNVKLQNKINTTIDLIGKEVKEYSRIQSKKNDVIINFLRTFNIIKDEESIRNMQFHEGSNLYSILRIIQNSDYNQLDSFSEFMTTVSRYSGLERGRNTLPEQQKNKCYKEIVTADTYDKKSARGYLKESLMNFEGETENLSDPHNLNFDYKRNLGMAQLIINNITDNSNSENGSSSEKISKSKFDVVKIKDFLTSLNTGEQMKFNSGNNEDFTEDELDKELEEKLSAYDIYNS